MFELSWNSEYAHFVFAVLWSVVGFTCYYFLSKHGSLASRIWKLHPELDVQVKQVLLQRAWGALFLGVIPAIFIMIRPGLFLHDFGLGFSFQASPPWWSYLFMLVIIVVCYFWSSKPGSLIYYPQMRIKKWTAGMLALSGISWVIFLIGYEFLFRGILLFASLDVMEFWPAVALNCTLYAFAHFNKGPGEIVGTIPLGLILCYLTAFTGNIWIAVLTHSVMALSNEWFSILSNPKMDLVRKVRRS